MRRTVLNIALCLALLATALTVAVPPDPALAAGPTTSVTVTRYDAYGNVIGTQSITYQQMESTLPVQGADLTRRYHQGPTFDDSRFDLLWDPGETVNIDSRDYGRAKGTDVRDLCDLVGGASPGDTVKIKASDNFAKWFDYEDIYYPEPEQGKLVVCWYNQDFGGYVPTYSTGMRLLFFAETQNPEGKYVFGDWDQHATLPASRWHYYFDGKFWPSSSGLSVQNVSNIDIYEPKLVSCDASGDAKDSFAVGETVYVKGLGLASNTNYKFWIQAEPVLLSPLNALDRPEGTYTLSAGGDPSGVQETITTNASGDFAPQAIWTIASLTARLTYDIVADNQASGAVGTYDASDFIDNPGWKGFEVTPLVAPVAAFYADVTSGTAPLTVHFIDQSTNSPTSWQWDFNNDGKVDSTAQNPSFTYATAGTYTVKLTAANGAGSDEEVKTDYITVTAPEATVNLNFALQGSSRPDPDGWEVPVTVRFFEPGADVMTDTPLYDSSGTAQRSAQGAVYSVAGIVPGTYDITIDGETTLMNVRRSVEIVSLTISVDIGTLLEGDANGDGVVDISDFTLLAASFMKMKGYAGFDARADFDRNGIVDISDFTLLAANFMKMSPMGPAPPPVAEFSADVTSGLAPLTVHFTDQSTQNPSSWAWDFDNNGTIDSTDQNPPYIYTTPGTYTVKLVATNAGGSDDEIKADYITVLDSVTLLWGPYLTGTTTTGTTINIKTDFPASATVEYATEAYYFANSSYDQSATDGISSEIHHVSLTGLEAGAVYHYRVTYGTQTTGDFHFSAFPASGPFTFVVYSDSQDQLPLFSQAERHKLVADAIAAEPNIAFVLNSGDLVNDGADLANWNRYFDAARAMMAGATVYPALGNHEDSSPLYFEAFGVPSYYSFDCGDGHFVVLDSTKLSTVDAQSAWLAGDLDGTSKPWKFVSFHHPAYTSDPNHFGGWENLRDAWEGIFTGNGVEAVWNGHNHVYERYLENGVTYTVIGTGGAPLYVLGDTKYTGYQNSLEHSLAYVKVTVDPASCTAMAQVIRVADLSNDNSQVLTVYPAGTIYDTFTLNQTYTIAASAGAGGSITPSGNVIVGYGDDQTFAITSDDGYEVTDVLVDGSSVGSVTSYTFTHIAANHTIAASFAQLPDSSSSTLPVAAFIAHVTSGTAPLTVAFTDQSTGGPTSWEWDFQNDGTVDSTIQNPTYTYTVAETYTVKLSVSNAKGSNSLVQTDYIRVTGPAPVAAFSANVTSGTAPLTVHFTDQSTGSPTSWAWDFQNDGTVDSTTQNPTYTYTVAETYTVKLTVTNSAGSDEETKGNYIGVSPTGGGTTSVTVEKYNASGGLINTTTVDYLWMEANLPVQGDGVIHYYHQGPTFDDSSFDAKWDPGETVNIDSRDYGAAKGTDVKDLCDLVGGASPGDTIKIKAIDNFSKWFDYEDVYTPEPAQGKMVVTWYCAGAVEGTPKDGTGVYVSAYSTGMRLLFFAETLNPEGKHVFGDWDMNQTLAESRWHYYYDGKFWPSSSGLSVKNVSTIEIHQSATILPSADFTVSVTSGTAPLTVHFTDQSTGSPTSWSWDFQNDGTIDSADQNPTFIYTASGSYSVKLTVTNSGGSDSRTKTSYILVESSPPEDKGEKTSTPTPMPTSTPTPTPESTPEPTLALTPEPTPEPTPALTPESTPEPTPALTPAEPALAPTPPLSTTAQMADIAKDTGGVLIATMPAVGANFTAQNARLGNVEAVVSVKLERVPDGASLSVTVSAIIPSEISSAYYLASATANMEVIDAAYVINVVRTNLENAIDIASATITMKVGTDWVEAHGGPDAIKVFRYDPDTGASQILETSFLGYDAQGRAIFKGISPEGLSAFGLLAVKAAPTLVVATSEPTSVPPGVIGTGSVSAESGTNNTSGNTTVRGGSKSFPWSAVALVILITVVAGVLVYFLALKRKMIRRKGG